MKLLKFIPFAIVLLSVFLISCENPVVPEEPPVKCEVTIEAENFEIEVGDSTEVTVSVSSPNGSTCDSGVNWKVDNEEIVSITQINKLTTSIKALEEGNVSVIAESIDDSEAFDEISISTSITPLPIICEVTIEAENFEIEVGDSTEVTVSVSSPNGSTCDSGVNWKADNEEIVSITQIDKNTASVKALEEGNVSITIESIDDTESKDVIDLDIIFTPFMSFTSNFKIIGMNKNGYTKIIIDRPGENYYSGWTPDGKKMSFLGHGGGVLGLYVANPDGSDEKLLTPNIYYTSLYDWSPDGESFVATMKLEEGAPSDLYIFNPSTKVLKKLTSEGVGSGKVPSGPNWSPDGEKIIFSSGRSGDWEIYIMNSDGSNQINLTNSPGSNEGSAKWSPDGNQIAFTSDVTGKSEIYVMNSDGSNVRQITNGHLGISISPDWSSDGSKIVFLNQGIRIINPNGSEEKLILNYSDLDHLDSSSWPSWRPGFNFDDLNF